MTPVNVSAIRDSGIAQPSQEAAPASDENRHHDSLPERGVETKIVSPTESLVQSQRAFHGDLPQLLREHPGRWVAYYKSECVKVGKKQELVYQYCLDQSFDEEDFIVLYVEPMNGLTLSSICH